MIFSKKKRQHANADLSEQAMNDSLRAAQVIFQRHADSQTSLDSSSTGGPTQTTYSQTRYRRPNGNNPTYRMQHQLKPRNSSGPMKNKTEFVTSNQQLSRPLSPVLNESAHAAAALAHMTLTREPGLHEELVGLSSQPQQESIPSSDRLVRDSVRNNSSKAHSDDNEPTTSESATKDILQPIKIKNSGIITPPSSLASSSLPKQQTVRSQSHPDIWQVPAKPQRRQLSFTSSTPCSSTNAVSATNVSLCPTKSNSRTLAGRIPPPNIYLQGPNLDDEQQQEPDGKESEEEGFSNQDLSSSSIVSSNSEMSLITGGSSYGGDDTVLGGEDDSDVEESENHEYQEAGYDFDECPPLQDEHENKTNFSTSTFNLSSEANDTASSRSLPPSTSPMKTSATYGTLNRISHGNVTYQGTLPDLIPNHTRRTRMERFKTKLFGSKNRSEIGNDQGLVRSSVTANEEGRPVVTTNQNLRFKTTMRGHEHHSSNDSEYNHNGEAQGVSNDRGNDSQYRDGALIDSDDEESDSIEDRKEGKKRKKRTARLKRRLKHTAGVVPYTHHLHNHDHRHHASRKGFNEDKPWKSHRDVGFVTGPERKRYEGMWVSNRCLYLELLPWWGSVMSGESVPPVKLPEDGLMLNLVVKDIWARSNLPDDLLMQIYDKVDTRGDGTLDRKSFVVGMWLVDQCLYGRKLPKVVDRQVWDSVDRYVVNVLSSNTMKQLGKSKKKLMKQEIKNIKKDIKNVHL